MLTFTRALPVAVGDPLLSRQYNKLAKAFAERILSGVADAPYRIHWLAHSLVRQIRQNDGDQITPHDEWWKFYGLIEPDGSGGSTLPEPAGAGTANPDNPLIRFIFGGDSPPSLEIGSEDFRLNDLASPSGSLSALWGLGKLQRGWFDAAAASGAGVQNAPAFEASASHYRIAGIYGYRSPWLKSYGGFPPQPLLSAPPQPQDCDLGLGAIRNYDIFFTRLTNSTVPGGEAAGDVRDYPLTCPLGTAEGDNDLTSVGGILYGARSYHVFHNNGTVDILPYRDWIEGPYTGGGELRRRNCDLLDMVLNQYVKEYRGSQGQREKENRDVGAIGFDLQSFYLKQYSLAPVPGTFDNTYDSNGRPNGTPIYPAIELTANTPDATALTFAPGGTARALPNGFVVAGYYASGIGLAKPCTVELTATVGSGTAATVQTVRITLAAGNDEALVYFDGESGNLRDGLGAAATAASPCTLTARLVGGLELSAGGRLRIEFAETQKYKPDFTDAYLMLRLGSTTGDALRNSDNRGLDFQTPKELSDFYLRYGCMAALRSEGTGLPDQFASGVFANPVYDAARKLLIDHCRLVAPLDYSADQGGRFVRYAVEGGKSILWFKRILTDQGASVDFFKGIGPSFTGSVISPITGSVDFPVRAGHVYLVKTGSVVYRRTTYSAGARFTGKYGASTFDSMPAGSEVNEYDGIRAVAGEDETSNEWCVFLSGSAFQEPPSDGPFKLDGYANPLGYLVNRAFFISQEVGGLKTTGHLSGPGGPINASRLLREHFSFGASSPFEQSLSIVLSPEAAPGYNYLYSANSTVASLGPVDVTAKKTNFFKSNPIYPPPYEVESAITDPVDPSLVKVTLKERLQQTADAATLCPSLDMDTSTWPAAYLVNDDAHPRTDENLVMDYLKYGLDSNPPFRLGDCALDETPATTLDIAALRGAVLPRFYFTKLPVKVFEDVPANDTYEPHDTPMLCDSLLQLQFYLRAMCEGYLDERSGPNPPGGGGPSACDLGKMFDYTYENLCFAALQNKQQYLSVLKYALRTDKPKGFGSAPDTEFDAEIFNQLVSCVNLLTKVRLELPLTLESRIKLDQTGILEIVPTGPPSADHKQFYWKGNPSGALNAVCGSPAPGPWVPVSAGSFSIEAFKYANIVEPYPGGEGYDCWNGNTTFGPSGTNGYGLFGQHQVNEIRLPDNQLALYAVPGYDGTRGSLITLLIDADHPEDPVTPRIGILGTVTQTRSWYESYTTMDNNTTSQDPVVFLHTQEIRYVGVAPDLTLPPAVPLGGGVYAALHGRERIIPTECRLLVLSGDGNSLEAENLGDPLTGEASFWITPNIPVPGPNLTGRYEARTSIEFRAESVDNLFIEVPLV